MIRLSYLYRKIS